MNPSKEQVEDLMTHIETLYKQGLLPLSSALVCRDLCYSYLAMIEDLEDEQ